jgi:glucose dehydrogenase
MKLKELFKMNKQAYHYEKAGDRLTGKAAIIAYHAAQNQLHPHEKGYMEDFKRLQEKIIKNKPQ